MKASRSTLLLLSRGGDWLLELRRHPRFRVRFRSSFSSPRLFAGEGYVVDLSQHGCKVISAVGVTKDAELELTLHSPDVEFPLAIDRAVVRWTREGQFGVEFLQFQQNVDEQLLTLLDASSQRRRD